MAQDLIDRLAREELAEDYLDDEAMSLVIDKVCMRGRSLPGGRCYIVGGVWVVVPLSSSVRRCEEAVCTSFMQSLPLHCPLHCRTPAWACCPPRTTCTSGAS